MKIKLSTLIPTVNHEKETREAELTTAKTEAESVEPVEVEPTQVHPEIPVAMPTDGLRSEVRRMYPELLRMSSAKIAARADRWEELEMTREAKIARKWQNRGNFPDWL